MTKLAPTLLKGVRQGDPLSPVLFNLSKIHERTLNLHWCVTWVPVLPNPRFDSLISIMVTSQVLMHPNPLELSTWRCQRGGGTHESCENLQRTPCIGISHSIVSWTLRFPCRGGEGSQIVAVVVAFAIEGNRRLTGSGDRANKLDE